MTRTFSANVDYSEMKWYIRFEIFLKHMRLPIIPRSVESWYSFSDLEHRLEFGPPIWCSWKRPVWSRIVGDLGELNELAARLIEKNYWKLKSKVLVRFSKIREQIANLSNSFGTFLRRRGPEATKTCAYHTSDKWSDEEPLFFSDVGKFYGMVPHLVFRAEFCKS